MRLGLLDVPLNCDSGGYVNVVMFVPLPKIVWWNVRSCGNGLFSEIAELFNSQGAIISMCKGLLMFCIWLRN